MNSYQYDIGEKERVGSRYIAHVRREVQRAFLEEKSRESYANSRSQQSLA